MRAPTRRHWAGILALLLIGSSMLAPIVGAVGVAPESGEQITADSRMSSAQFQTNNTSVRHEDPRESDEDGDIGAVRSHLAKQMLERLGSSTIMVSQGQYDRAKGLVGEEYRSALEKYVDVEGETDERGAASTFEEAGQEQREFTNVTQSYRETYQEYREAKQNGNERRARQLARELERLSGNVTRTGDELAQTTRGLGNATGTNISDTVAIIREIQQNVSQQQAAVVQAEFEPTRLSIQTPKRQISFLNPLQITGTLETQNGTLLRNRTIVVSIAGNKYQLKTDETAQFEFGYRPVTLPLDTETLTVRYVPRDSSIYLGSNSTVDVDLRQTNATTLVTTDVKVARFGDQVTISGRVVADENSVPGLPLRVSIGDRVLGLVRTAEDGTFSIQTKLPAGIPVGEVRVTVALGVENRAVTSRANSSVLTVEPTQSKLDLNLTSVQGSWIEVRGRLLTEEGTPVANQDVEIRVNGTTVTTLQTGPSGTYRGTVTVPKSLTGNVRVVSQFSGTGTNLERATATDAAFITRQQEDPSSSSSPISRPAMIAIAAFLISLLGLGGLLRWRQGRDEGSTAPTSPPASTSVDSESGFSPGESLLESATTLQAAGELKGAIEVGYAAGRQALVGRFGLDERGTHREFQARASQQIPSEIHDTLATLTDAYERSTYGPGELSEAEVTEILKVAEKLVSEAS